MTRPRCTICGRPDINADQRCMTCYQYRRRTGRDRTWEQIAKANAKAIDRALARRWCA